MSTDFSFPETNYRLYGKAPYRIAVIHGGPGAPGQMAPVAQRLSEKKGVLEPLQTKATLDGQVEELRETLDTHGHLPITLIGSSWGAWLSLILAARYPYMVQKLILVGSGPLESKYAQSILPTRLSRLSEDEKQEIKRCMIQIPQADKEEKNQLFEKVGDIFSKADTYSQSGADTSIIKCDYEVFAGVWSEANKLRESGGLVDLCKDIYCPVLAIHGDFDPHPAKGVQEPLVNNLSDFEMVLLEKCGHLPWLETHGKEPFFKALFKALPLA